MNLQNVLPRRYLVPLTIVSSLGMLAMASVAYAQDGRPGSPTGLNVSAGDTEATITWAAPEAVGESACAPTDYEVSVTKVDDGSSTHGSEVRSPWIATGLDPSTEYRVSVWAYSADCDDYSARPAKAEFSTTASDTTAGAEPAVKHAPKRVRRLRAARTSGQTDSATLTWNAPNTKNGKHYAATDYSVKIISLDQNGNRISVDYIHEIVDTQVIVNGLSAGVYRFSVAAYNSDCNCNGRIRAVRYTHQ